MSVLALLGGVCGIAQAIATAVLPPWPEWNDAEVNAEKWDLGLGQTSKGKEKGKMATPAISSLSAPYLGFEDPIGHCDLPPSLEVDSWKRPTEISDNFAVVHEQAHELDFDLVTNNLHLLHSPIMRDIIAALMNLYHYAEIEPFHSELECGNFVPTGGLIWRPWHHVYSCCKVGKGQTHKPNVNPTGKYNVRLFYLGAWRRITVDDYIPVDRYRRVLLPTTLHTELWPIMLTKALLKVARLTWRLGKEVVDFSVTTCLTGWMLQKIDCCHIPYLYLWQICQKVLMADDDDVTLRFGFGGEKVESERNTLFQKHYSSILPERHTLKVDEDLIDIGTNPEHEILGKVIMYGVMRDIIDIPEELADVGPCMAHSVLLSEARVFFLGEYGDGTPFPLWKVFRWKAWAIKKGIIKDIRDINMKSVRLFSPLKKITIPDPEVLEAQLEALAAIEAESSHAQAGQGDGLKSELKKKGSEKEDAKSASSKGSKKSKKSGKSEASAKKSTTSKSSGKSNTSKDKSASKDKVKDNALFRVKPNTDSWMDIHILTEYLESLKIFYRPSAFTHTQKIYDVSQVTQVASPVGKPQSTKKGALREGSNHSVSSRGALPNVKTTKATNECFYLYSDSNTCKKLFFTLAVVPSGAIDNCVRVMKGPNVSPTLSSNEVCPEKSDISLSYVTGEIYQWKSISDNGPKFAMRTYGTNSILCQLGEGIQVLRIWCKVPQHHMLQISSQTPYFIGSKDRVQEKLGNDSESLNFYSMQMFSKFADLATSTIGSPEHLDALTAFHNSYMPPSEINFIPSHHQSSNTLKRVKMNHMVRTAFEHAVVYILYGKLKDNFDAFNASLVQLQNWFDNRYFGFEPLSEISPEFLENIEALLSAAALKAEIEAAEAAAAAAIEAERQLLEGATANPKSKKDDSKKSKGGSKVDGKKNKSDGKSDAKNKKEKKSAKVKSETGSTGSKKDGRKGKQGKGNRSSHTSYHILFESQRDSITILHTMIAYEHGILKYYPFRNDINMHLVYSDFKGVVKVAANQDWIPLVRYIVNVHHDLPAFNEIDLQTSLQSAVLRVIDNDTLEELTRVTSKENKNIFYQNELGYTLFAYGFNDNLTKPKEHTWKLRTIAEDKSNILHHCEGMVNGEPCTAVIPPPHLSMQEVKGYYFPNRLNNILRCLLTIPVQQIVSLRITVNKPDVEFIFTICHEETFTLVSGCRCRGNVIIPCVQLCPKRDEEDKIVTTVFLLEAEVINESWHLTEEETSLVNTLKEHAMTRMLIYSQEDKINLQSKKTTSRKFSQSSLPRINSKNVSSLDLEPGAPQWTVQLVIDDEHGPGVVLEINRRKAEEVRRLKATWEQEDPGRHKYATKLREDYLEYRKQEEIKEERKLSDHTPHHLIKPSRRWVNLRSTLPRDSYVQGRRASEWKIMTDEHVKQLVGLHNQQREDFEQMHNSFMEELHHMNDEQKRKHSFTFNHYNKEREMTSEIMQQAYDVRDEFVRKEHAKLAQADAKGKKGKKDKKDKTDKKDKKGESDASSKKSKKK